MADKLLPFRREQLGTAAGDRLQRPAQQATQKINAIIGNYVLREADLVALQGNVAVTSASMADVAGLSFSVTAQPGDILMLDAAIAGTISAGAGLGYVMWSIVDGPTTGTIAASGPFTNVVAVTAPMSGLWVVQNKGTIAAKVQAQQTGGSTLTLYGNTSGAGLRSTIRLQHMRKVS